MREKENRIFHAWENFHDSLEESKVSFRRKLQEFEANNFSFSFCFRGIVHIVANTNHD